MTAEKWHLSFMGDLSVKRGNTIITHFERRATPWLLAFLSLCPDGRCTRTHLTNTFWPDAPKGSSQLRVHLHYLTRLLDTQQPATERILKRSLDDTIALNPDAYTSDVSMFRQSIRKADRAHNIQERVVWLEEAITHYGGKFLPNCTLDWAEIERVILSQEHGTVHHRLAEAYQELGDVQKAIREAQLAIKADPSVEEYHATLMRCYLEMGNPQQALDQFAFFRDWLQQNLNDTPRAALCALEKRAFEMFANNGSSAPSGLIANIPVELSSTSGGSSATSVSPARSPVPYVPAFPFRLFGRAQELDLLSRLFTISAEADAHSTSAVPRLVTLLGAGGMGKTSIARVAAQRLRFHYKGRVYFVDLSGHETAARLFYTIRDSLGIEPRQSTAPLTQIAEFVGSSPTLLILDNFEPLIPEGCALVRELMEVIPSLRLLVTSRESLGLHGEQRVDIGPLPVPPVSTEDFDRGFGEEKKISARDLHPNSERQSDESNHHHLETEATLDSVTLLEFAGVALFDAYARLQNINFKITRQNAMTVARLCVKLEGIPLALELAASRIDVMTPARMLREIDRRFQWLVSHRRDVPERHRALYAVISSMFFSLSPRLQECLLCLSVFRGGWSEEAAMAVCMSEDILTDLQQLQSCSLVSRVSGELDTEGEGVRFRMYDTIRAFAQEELAKRGAESRHSTMQRQADFFIAYVGTLGAKMRGPEVGTAVRKVEADLENIYGALEWLIAQQQADASMILGASVGRFWRFTGRIAEGRQFMERVLALSDAPSTTRLSALQCASGLAREAGDDYQLEPLLFACLELAQALGDASWYAWSLYAIGDYYLARGRYPEAREALDDSLPRFIVLDETYGLACVLHKIGSLSLVEGRLDEAIDHFQRARDKFDRIDDPLSALTSLLNIGNIYTRRWELEPALACYKTCLQGFQELRLPKMIGSTSTGLGGILLRLNADAEAAKYLQEAVSLCRRHASPVYVAQPLRLLGYMEWCQRNWNAARAYFRESLILLRTADSKWYGAHLLFEFARLEHSVGRHERAANLLGAMETLLQILNVDIDAMEHLEQDETHRLYLELQETLGTELFETHRIEGAGREWLEVVEYALEEK